MTSITFNLTPCSTGLPETHHLASKPLLFVVNDLPYVGHFHDNGWFYEDTGDRRMMAAGSTRALEYNPATDQIATSWAFLRP